MSRTVTRRRVFYIPGYDPIHPRRYRELYRSESAAQAEISGYDIALKPKATPTTTPTANSKAKPVGTSRYGWRVEARIEGHETQVDVEVLVWSDIVRDSMEQGILATYGQLVRTAWTYIGSGVLWRLMRLRKGPVIAALYPVVFLIVQLLLAIALGAAITWAGRTLLTPFLGLAGQVIALAAGAGIAWWLLNWFKARDGKVFAYYLMHDYAYSARHKGANPPELETRMAEFTAEIAEALTGDVDEVLVVGHSSGAHLAVSILSDLVRARSVPETGPKLSFLSLGQVVPMVSFLSDAYRLRADLQYLSERDELTWIDVTAPGDGCAFALCDPVAVSGVATPAKRWPLVLSAAFTRTLSPERWKELRWKFFRLHFQYLCAFDRPGDYDYFRITAGPRTLGDRFEGRKPSKSRIETAVSKFSGIAP